MTLSDVLYSLGWQTVRPLLTVAGLFSPKLARAVAGRKAAAASMRRWAADREADAEKAGPLLWLHGASAGELAGAAPIVDALRRRRPALRLAVTYSSPSGEKAAGRLDPEYHGFVPMDLRGHTDAAVDALAPSALVYAKLDVWPNLTASAEAAGVPAGMVNATVRPGSGRLRQPGRAVLARAYGKLSAVGAATAADARRLEEMGVRPGAITVTGDASFDQALARLAAAGAEPARPLRLPPRPAGALRVIAGSTWPEDDAFLVEAAADLDDVELVLVPHEPTPEAVARIRERTEARIGRPIRLHSELATVESPRPDTSPLVVDAVGLLAELYAEGDVAYVGGALAGTGLHSVIEPAACGLPVLFGSRHDRWEATELVKAGAALEVEASTIHPALVSLRDIGLRRRMGAAARKYVEMHAGAGEAGADLVEELMRGRL